MNELRAAAQTSETEPRNLERICRLDRLFRDADLGVALELFRSDPERFTCIRRPGAVRCVGRKQDGTLCGRLFVSPDKCAVRRCGSCHVAEQEFETENWRTSQWRDRAGSDFDLGPSRKQLIRLESELQEMSGPPSVSFDQENDA